MQLERWSRVFIAAGLVAWCAALAGCERKPESAAPLPTDTFDTVPLPEDKPEYVFADGLAEQHPEIVGFMRQFLETCLAGDYSGYRRLVTRTADPESRARFEKVLHTLKTMEVRDINSVSLPEIDAPAYLVTCFATFRDPKESEPGRRKLSRRNVAILVLREEGQWRMGIAPPEWQPEDQPEAPAKPTTTSAPSYPWDEDIDY